MADMCDEVRKKPKKGEKGTEPPTDRTQTDIVDVSVPAWNSYETLPHPCYLSRQASRNPRIHSRATTYTGGGNDDGYLAQSAHDRSMSPSFPPSGELLLGYTATTVRRSTLSPSYPLLSPPCCCVHSALRVTTLQPLSSYAPVVATPTPRPSHSCFCPRQGENGSGAGGTRGWRR